MSSAVQGLALLLWSADLTHPERVATPFVMAQAAAALDQRVELYFTARSVHLLTPEAGKLPVGFGPERQPLAAYLTQMGELDIPLYACGQALYAAGLQRADLISQCAGLGGSVQFMGRSVEAGWRTLVF